MAKVTAPILGPDEWQTALEEHRTREEKLTTARDELAAARRRLPWTPIDKEYRFDVAGKTMTLRDLFDGHSQLITYRFFFEPGVEGWPDAGCVGCSLFVDNLGHPEHLRGRDTNLVLVSPAPQDRIARYKQRMGWDIPWCTTVDDFVEDFDATDWFAINVFIRSDDQIYRTFFVSGREVEIMGNAWTLLDLTPLGRQEDWEDSPDGYPQRSEYLWRRHDEYQRLMGRTSASS